MSIPGADEGVLLSPDVGCVAEDVSVVASEDSADVLSDSSSDDALSLSAKEVREVSSAGISRCAVGWSRNAPAKIAATQIAARPIFAGLVWKNRFSFSFIRCSSNLAEYPEPSGRERRWVPGRRIAYCLWILLNFFLAVTASAASIHRDTIHHAVTGVVSPVEGAAVPELFPPAFAG